MTDVDYTGWPTSGVDGFQYGAVTYPLAAQASGANLTTVCDPAIGVLIAYIKNAIEVHVGPALISACSGGFAPITAAVETTMGIEPTRDMFAKGAGFKFPMLAVWRKETEFTDHTTEFRHDTTRVTAAYILPPLTAAQEVRLLPVLAAVSHVIDYAFFRGYDPTYNGGQRIFWENNIERCRVVSASYEKIALGESDSIEFAAVTVDMMLREGNEQYTAGAPPLTGTETSITDESVQPANPIEIIEADTPLS